LPNIPIIGHVGAGMTILGEGNLVGYPEIDRLVGDRSNRFVLWVEEDLVSDLRERQLWRTPEGLPDASDHGGQTYEQRHSGWRL
jgi:hypothetical protein